MGLEVVATGSWVYDGIAESPVWTVRADFDFWYEIEHPLQLTDELSDTVLVLRKKE